MFETIGIGIALILICVVFAFHASDLLAFIAEPIQAWLNKKYGFPRNVKTGNEGLLNKMATVSSKFEEDPESEDIFGQVNIHGEIWRAKTNRSAVQKMKIGTSVIITRIEGLTLEVETIAEPMR